MSGPALCPCPPCRARRGDYAVGRESGCVVVHGRLVSHGAETSGVLGRESESVASLLAGWRLRPSSAETQQQGAASECQPLGTARLFPLDFGQGCFPSSTTSASDSNNGTRSSYGSSPQDHSRPRALPLSGRRLSYALVATNPSDRRPLPPHLGRFLLQNPESRRALLQHPSRRCLLPRPNVRPFTRSPLPLNPFAGPSSSFNAASRPPTALSDPPA